MKAHTKIGAVEMGLLTACGCVQIMATKLPTVGVLSTGNELQDSEEPLKEGHVYDSNKITLMTMLKNAGYDPIDMGIAADKYVSQRKKAKQLFLSFHHILRVCDTLP